MAAGKAKMTIYPPIFTFDDNDSFLGIFSQLFYDNKEKLALERS